MRNLIAPLLYGMALPNQHAHVQAKSTDDKVKLEPNVATGCVDGHTHGMVVWYGMVWYGMVWYGSMV